MVKKLKNRKLLIIESAIQCMKERGSGGTNSNVVAKIMGIRPSNVFYYFPKQSDLFEAMVDYIILSNIEVVGRFSRPQTSFRAQLEDYIVGNLKWGEENPAHVAVLYYGISEVLSNREIGTVVAESLQNGEERVYTLLAKGVVEREFVVVGEIRDASKVIHQAVIGAITQQLLSLTGQVDRSIRYLTTILDQYLVPAS